MQVGAPTILIDVSCIVHLPAVPKYVLLEGPPYLRANVLPAGQSLCTNVLLEELPAGPWSVQSIIKMLEDTTGPLLFIIFVNDISKCCQFSKYLLYADDLKIF